MHWYFHNYFKRLIAAFSKLKQKTKNKHFKRLYKILLFAATCYGDGVYFAVDASYSLQRTYSPKDIFGKRFLYQCKVLTGSYTTGYSGMKVLPVRAGEERYDSATDCMIRPSMFVIFHDAQAYPEYLITFC